MNARIVILAAILASASACSSSAGSCAQTVSGNMICADYASGVTSDNARSACTGSMGSYSTTACTSTNRIGRCAVPGTIGGTQTTSTLNMYNPLTDANARQLCTLLMGTYTPG